MPKRLSKYVIIREEQFHNLYFLNLQRFPDYLRKINMPIYDLDTISTGGYMNEKQKLQLRFIKCFKQTLLLTNTTVIERLIVTGLSNKTFFFFFY